jgi:hypothetical protein
MEGISADKGKSTTEGMRQPLSQSERFVAPCERLIGIAEQPQDPGPIGETGYPRISLPIDRSIGTVLLRIVEGSALLEVYSG